MSIVTLDASGAEVVYTRYRIEGTTATYIASDNSDIDKDQLVVTSKLTGTSGNSYGNRRSTIKLIDTVDCPVPNQTDPVTKDMRGSAELSIPVGASAEAIRNICYKLASKLQDDTFINSLFISGQIDY